jgi:hypothetical protein
VQGAALHEDVARLEMDFGAFLQFHVDFAGDHHGVVDRVGTVHARRNAGREFDDAENRSAGERGADFLRGGVGVAGIVEAPGRFDTMFFEISSIFTMARPLPSCPVTTRRTFIVMVSPDALLYFDRSDYTWRRARSRSQGAGRSCIIALRFGRRGRYGKRLIKIQ